MPRLLKNTTWRRRTRQLKRWWAAEYFISLLLCLLFLPSFSSTQKESSVVLKPIIALLRVVLRARFPNDYSDDDDHSRLPKEEYTTCLFSASVSRSFSRSTSRSRRRRGRASWNLRTRMRCITSRAKRCRWSRLVRDDELENTQNDAFSIIGLLGGLFDFHIRCCFDFDDDDPLAKFSSDPLVFSSSQLCAQKAIRSKAFCTSLQVDQKQKTFALCVVAFLCWSLCNDDTMRREKTIFVVVVRKVFCCCTRTPTRPTTMMAFRWAPFCWPLRSRPLSIIIIIIMYYDMLRPLAFN